MLEKLAQNIKNTNVQSENQLTNSNDTELLGKKKDKKYNVYGLKASKEKKYNIVPHSRCLHHRYIHIFQPYSLAINTINVY